MAYSSPERYKPPVNSDQHLNARGDNAKAAVQRIVDIARGEVQPDPLPSRTPNPVAEAAVAAATNRTLYEHNNPTED